MIPLTCKHCNYFWHTKSRLRRVTCPKCRGKTINIDQKTLKRALKNILGI